MVVFYYFDGFPEDTGTEGPDIGYDLCFVEVDGVLFVSAECSATSDH
jgi:hypothetical protein